MALTRSFRTYAALFLLLAAGFDLLIVDLGIYRTCSIFRAAARSNDWVRGSTSRVSLPTRDARSRLSPSSPGIAYRI